MEQNEVIASALLSEAHRRKMWETPQIEDASISGVTAKCASCQEAFGVCKNGS